MLTIWFNSNALSHINILPTFPTELLEGIRVYRLELYHFFLIMGESFNRGA
jgi:hypothetical protein